MLMVTGIKDTNGFGHWNKLWWQAKEMLGNGQKDGWKAKTITQLRQQIPNKRGDETTHHGKLLSQIKSYYGAQDMIEILLRIFLIQIQEKNLLMIG